MNTEVNDSRRPLTCQKNNSTTRTPGTEARSGVEHSPSPQPEHIMPFSHLAALPRAQHCHFGNTFWLKSIFGMSLCGWRTQAGQPRHAAARAKEALEKQLEQQRQAKRAKYLEQEQKKLRRKERHEQHCMEMHDRRCGRATRQGTACKYLPPCPPSGPHWQAREARKKKM